MAEFVLALTRSNKDGETVSLEDAKVLYAKLWKIESESCNSIILFEVNSLFRQMIRGTLLVQKPWPRGIRMEGPVHTTHLMKNDSMILPYMRLCMGISRLLHECGNK